MATNSKAKGPFQGDRVPPEIRFWSKVNKHTLTGCWDWIGSKNNYGYGEFGFRRKVVKAHRFSYELVNGPIPKGAVLMHSCDRPCCVNPNHLSPGTLKDNSADCSAKGRNRNRKNRVTEATVKSVLDGIKAGLTTTLIAQHCGVSLRTVQVLKAGKPRKRKQTEECCEVPARKEGQDG